MAKASQKNCDGAWTIDEIIENANKWSLAGDVALLNTIELFSKKMLLKTEELTHNIDNLLNNLDEVGLKLDISQNQFHSLKNTQFIENRVYEDDETLDSEKEEKVFEKPPSEEEQGKLITQSVISGLEILNNYYDTVEVSMSDSDEEDDTAKSFVLKPKDMYVNRPLPPIIGTDEWYKRWNSEDSSSDNESNKMSDIYSESDSEDNLPKDLFKGSETSSEMDISSQTSENRPVANSTSNDYVRRPDMVTSSEGSEELEPPTANASVSSKSFAEQLAAKLDRVISKEEDFSDQINRERIQPAKSNTFSGNIFSDEPPPLDETNDGIFSKSATTGLFSGSKNLFNENEDFLPYGNNKKNVLTEKTEEVERCDYSQDINKNSGFLPKSSQVSKGLFDSDDSSDDGIFSTIKKKQPPKLPFLQPSKPVVPAFDDEPPQLEDEHKSHEEFTKKKPTGGVSIFGNTNIFNDAEVKNILKNQQRSITEDFLEENVKLPSPTKNTVPKKDIKEKVQIKQNKFDLFGDDSEETTPEVNKRELKSKHNLFDEEDVDMEEEIQVKKGPKTSYVHDTPEVEETTDEKDKKTPKNISLFDDEFSSIVGIPSKNSNLSLFDDDEELFKDDLFSDITSKKFKSNLFDDLENSNNIFGNKIDVVNTRLQDELRNKNGNVTKDIVTILSDQMPDIKIEETSNRTVSTVEVESKFKDTSKSVDDLNNNGSPPKSEDNVSMDIDPDEALFKDTSSLKLFEGDDNDDLFYTKSYDRTIHSSDLVFEQNPRKLEITAELTSTEHSEPREEKVTVRLFDSSPPPDDNYDWDTKSDNFSDAEDYTPYSVDENLQRASLFDDEPPSLGPNESSGIVGDNSTRTDTDDSSFYPYASSSRRLSSDISREQQSQDSFFDTKNKSESAALEPSLEYSEITTIDVTPSGCLEDLDSTEKAEDLQNNVSIEESTQTKFISAKNDCTTDEAANKKINEGKSILKQIVENKNNQENKLPESPLKEVKRENESELFQKNSTIASITEMLKNESENKISSEVKVSPGKLKHSMNINVNALMPGYSPQKEKPSSPIQEKLSYDKPEIAHKSSVSAVRKNLSGTTSEKSVTFDEVDNVEVLHSITKDRAKIPLKRRPSTRRGRLAAISKDSMDNNSSNEERPVEKEFENSSVSSPVEKEEKTSSELAKVEIFPRDTEDFNIPNPTEPLEIFKQKSSKEEYPSLLKEQSDKHKTLFDSGSESDSDLFSSSQNKKTKKLKKSLFDDDSSGEDLFSKPTSSSIERRSGSSSKSNEKKIPKPTIPRKLENIETCEDPLSNLLK
ncbi:hypothetical protein JTB14_016031 [Gonioctena quinquepunctata]|nr:hypothetical protein JTB14_016031 [Gonioctena quinquepunctata]